MCVIVGLCPVPPELKFCWLEVEGRGLRAEGTQALFPSKTPTTCPTRTRGEKISRGERSAVQT